MLDFVDITTENIHWYCRFEQCFEEELKNYQSRIYPHNSDFFIPLIEQGMLKWNYLFYDGKMIGAIWLEKEHASLRTAKLGIFIADREMRSQGIGQRAIDRYIRCNKKLLNLAEITLNVRRENIRAIRCYEKCGFVCEQQYEKADGTKIMSMVKNL